MDNDGVMDLVTYGKGTVRIWQLDGTADWSLSASFQTGTPGYAEALRAGPDVDFNGRPDICLISVEGSWPYDKNHLRFYREKSKILKPGVRLSLPKGNETFHRGAVIFIDWVCALPSGMGGSSKVDLKLSTTGPAGPWIDLDSNLPNSGRYQWAISPALPSSFDCRIRIQVTWSSGSVSFINTKSFSLD
jgi:hypothetical protein